MPTAQDSRAANEAHGAQTGLFVLALLYTIYFARPVLLPLTLGLILDFLFRPVVRALKRRRVPEPAGAALVILALVGGFGVGPYTLSGPASEWLAHAPPRPPPGAAGAAKAVRAGGEVGPTAAEGGQPPH